MQSGVVTSDGGPIGALGVAIHPEGFHIDLLLLLLTELLMMLLLFLAFS